MQCYNCTIDLGHAGSRGRVQNLTVQIRLLDSVTINKSDRADACPREVSCSGASQSAQPDDQNGSVFQSELA